MGFRTRYSTALLILCLAPGIVQGAVRQTLKPTALSLITESTAGVSLPNGAAAYYGNERYYALDNSLQARAGSVVGPTIRPVPVSTVGVPSFPYGGTPYNPDVKNGAQITVKPKAIVPKAPVITKFKSLLKVTPSGLLLSAGTLAATASVGWAFDELTGQLSGDKEEVNSELLPGTYYFTSGTADRHPSGYAACVGYTNTYAALNTTASYHVVTTLQNFSMTTPTSGTCTFLAQEYFTPTNNLVSSRTRTSNVTRTGTSCPDLYTYNATLGHCSKTGLGPLSPSQIDAVDLSSIPQDWFDGLLKDTCKNSPSPTSCFEELRSESPVEGPALIKGPSSVSTQTKMNPDGSTTTTTTTTQREHPVTYGNGYFDVGTRETKTTDIDGQTVATETSEDTSIPAPSDPDAAPQPEPQEEVYTFDDPDFPDIEPFYEVKYPDGLSGVWSSTYASVQDTAFIGFMQGFVPSFSGSCPSFGLSFAIASWASFGNIDFSTLCYVFDFIKILLLVTAMFTSRALIFGG